MSAMCNFTGCEANKPLLIVFSHLRWDFVFQRPQHLLNRAAIDFDVIFIEEPLVDARAPGFLETTRGPVTLVQPLLPPGTPAFDALAHQKMIASTMAARAGNRPIYLWYYTPMALDFSRDIAADLVIFDKMDELAAFDFAPPRLRANEAALMDLADLVFTGGASLHAAAQHRNPEVHCFPSSIDRSHFARARNGGDDPQSQRSIAQPRIGFFGVIDERIDYELIAQVAERRPDWQLVMIGPTAKIDPANLPKRANIHWLGARPYAELPDYLAHWDLGWMPFARNAATAFISPTKTPEFLAAGLPLMSTAIRDVVDPYGQRGLVEIADDAAAMVAAGDRLLAQTPRQLAAWRTQVDAHLLGSSWDTTWTAMRALIEAAITDSQPDTVREIASV